MDALWAGPWFALLSFLLIWTLAVFRVEAVQRERWKGRFVNHLDCVRIVSPGLSWWTQRDMCSCGSATVHSFRTLIASSSVGKSGTFSTSMGSFILHSRIVLKTFQFPKRQKWKFPWEGNWCWGDEFYPLPSFPVFWEHACWVSGKGEKRQVWAFMGGARERLGNRSHTGS